MNWAAFAGYPGCDVYVEAVSNGTATLTYAYAGTGDAAGIACQATLKMTAWEVEFVHAEGDEVGQPMEGLPVFTPCSGTGKGVPVYDSPDADLAMSFTQTGEPGIRSANVTWLGAQYTVFESSPYSRMFTNAALTLAVSDGLLCDAGVLEWLTASFSSPALGVTNAVYTCAETAAEASTFENEQRGLIFTVSASVSAPRTATLDFSSEWMSDNIALTETGTGTGLFVGGTISVRPAIVAGQPYLAVTDGALLTNALFSVWETAPQSGIYRNYNDPVSTDLPASALAVPVFAPWRLKIKGIADSSAISQISVTTSVDSVSQITFTTVGGSLVSEKKFLLVPNRDFDAPVPSGYTPLVTDTQSEDWKSDAARRVGASVLLAMAEKPAGNSKNRVEDAVVLMSIKMGILESMATGLDPEAKIRDPIQDLGYWAVPHYKASKAVALQEAKGKQIWYSLSHSHLVTNLPNNRVSFNGLKFLNEEKVRTSDLTGLNLGYKLVMIDGCCSAMTERLDAFCVLLGQVYNGPEKFAARNNNNLVEECMDFADVFGEDSAYVGWAWVMNPATAQGWMSEFLQNLKGGKTVQQARDVFIANGEVNNQPDVRLMKVYGSVENVIDKAGTHNQ